MIEIFFGVISGIITTGLLVLAGFLFNRVFAPWYQRLVYKGVEIAGTWEGNITDPNNITLRLRLQLGQSAHKITGEGILARITADKAEDTTYLSLNGELWEGFLNATLRSKDRTRLSFGALLLKVCKGGRALKGIYTIRNTYNDEIVALSFDLSKKN